MSKQKSNSVYFSGLSEIVDSPSPLTYSFLNYWFRGNTSFGRAMKILGIPYIPSALSMLSIYKERLGVDIHSEESILYSQTVLDSNTSNDPETKPKQHVSLRKMINPRLFSNTIKLIIVHAKWMANKDKTIHLATRVVNEIPEPKGELSFDDIDKKLCESIWPKVIAVATLTEFFNQLLESNPKSLSNNLQLVANLSSPKDWLYQSMSDQIKVKKKELSFSKYIEIYGMRADDDYELSEPRFIENQTEIKKRIANLIIPNSSSISETKSDDPLVSANVSLQILRSEVKKRVLPWIYLLRKSIMEIAGTDNISHLSRQDILDWNIKPTTISAGSTKKLKKHSNHTTTPKIQDKSFIKEGSGRGISIGTVQKKTINIRSTVTKIPANRVCVFPNASPKYSHLYTRCEGIIFLSGGTTSHGAIVAREYAIPALVDPKANNIPDNTTITIDGATAKWNTVN